MSIFDPAKFMAEVEMDANPETEYPVVPAGTYNATVQKVEVIERSGEKNGREYCFHALEVQWKFDDADVAKEYGVEYIRSSTRLDIVASDDGESFKLEKGLGKNIPLGKLQTALGLASSRASFQDFVGKTANLQVSVDPKGYNQVKGMREVE